MKITLTGQDLLSKLSNFGRWLLLEPPYGPPLWPHKSRSSINGEKAQQVRDSGLQGGGRVDGADPASEPLPPWARSDTEPQKAEPWAVDTEGEPMEAMPDNTQTPVQNKPVESKKEETPAMAQIPASVAEVPPAQPEQETAQQAGTAAAAEATEEDLEIDELMSLFTEDDTKNEELERLAAGLEELNASSLASECVQVAADLKQRWPALRT